MAAPLFSPNLTVAQTLQAEGELARVFIDRKTACVGCYLSRFCTLEEVAKTYEFPVEELLGELQRAAYANQSSLTLTGAQNE
jgi:hypothetical protein